MYKCIWKQSSFKYHPSIKNTEKLSLYRLQGQEVWKFGASCEDCKKANIPSLIHKIVFWKWLLCYVIQYSTPSRVCYPISAHCYGRCLWQRYCLEMVDLSRFYCSGVPSWHRLHAIMVTVSSCGVMFIWREQNRRLGLWELWLSTFPRTAHCLTTAAVDRPGSHRNRT